MFHTMKNLIEDKELFNHLIKGKWGFYLYNQYDRYLGQSLKNYGEYSEGEVDLFKAVLNKESYVVEVGANIGALTVPLAKICHEGKIFAFEAQKLLFQTLNANMALNSIRNVTTNCLIISDIKEANAFVQLKDQDLNLENKEVSLGSYHLSALQSTKKESAHKSQIISLDNFYGEPKLDFLKIDVEGMESEVLRGAKNLIEKFKPTLYLENDRKEKSKTLLELLFDLEYSCYWHLPPLFNSDNYFSKKENIFPSIVSLNILCLPSSIHPPIELAHLKKIHNSDEFPSVGYHEGGGVIECTFLNN